MGNCLVTKLKENVNNPELVKLNWIRIPFDNRNISDVAKLPTSETGYGIDSTVITTLSDGTQRTEVMHTNETVVLGGIGEVGYVDIENKYQIRNLMDINVNFDLSNITYCTYILNIRGESFVGDVKNIQSTELRSILFNPYSNVYGDISLVPSTYISYIEARETGVTFNPSVFGQNQVNFGRTSGQVSVYLTLSDTGTIVRFGSSMQNPTAEETAQGYQIVNV